MLKHTSAALLLTALALSGCHQKSADISPADTLAFNDFENLESWLTDTPLAGTLSKENAHSGVYSTRVGYGHEFSIGYSNPLGRLAPELPTRLTISGWVLLANPQSTPILVTEIKNPGSTGPGLLWDGIELAKELKPTRKWQYVERTITIPAGATPASRLQVYLWRTQNDQPSYLDDLRISRARE